MDAPQAAADAGTRRLSLSDDEPWPGLAAYDEASHDYFQGRDLEAAELLRLVNQFTVTALYGQSGLGKSSLLQAGLFPLLRAQHHLPVYLRLNFGAGVAPPMEQLMQGLVAALEAAGADHTPPDPGETPWRYLHRRELELWSRDNYPLTPVLVLDQFEELFAPRPPEAPSVDAVMNALGDLIESRVPDELAASGVDRHELARYDTHLLRYRIVLSFREDYLAAIKGWERKVPSLLRNFLHLEPMSRAQAIAAVARPGAKLLAPGAAQAIVEFVGRLDPNAPADGSVEPVLLSLFCSELNARRAPGALIDGALIERFGENILEDFYRRALADMPPSVGAFIEEHLVQGDRFRASYAVDVALQDGRISPQQLAQLTSGVHLLRIDAQGGVPRIELIHDRLVSVVVAARKQRRALEAESAQRAEAERERAAQAQVAEAQRLRRGRNLWRGIVVSLGVVVLVGYAGLVRMNELRREASAATRQATALRLAAEAQSTLAGVRDGSDQGALLQLLAAKRIAPDNPSIDAQLLAALTANARLARIIDAGSAGVGIAFSPDSKRIAAAAADGTIHLWDTASGAEAGRALGAPGPAVLALAFSPDGRRLAAGGQDATLHLYDADSGAAVAAERVDGGAALHTLAFSDDGAQLASGDAGGAVRWWDPATGRPLGAASAHTTKAVNAIAFSHRGDRLAVAGEDGTVRLLDTATRLPVLDEWPGTGAALNAVTFSPDDSRLATGGVDGVLQLSDARTLKPWSGTAPDAGLGHEDIITALAIQRDPKRPYLVTASNDRTLRVWNAETGAAVGAPIAGHDLEVGSVAFSPDGRLIASASADGTLRLWNANPGADLGAALGGHAARVLAIAFGGSTRVVSIDAERWVAARDAVVRRRAADRKDLFSIDCAAIAPDGRRYVAALPSGQLQQWRIGEPDDGAAVGAPMAGHADGTLALAYSADGARIASGGQDGVLRLWDAATGRAIAGSGALGAAITSVAFDAAGRRVAVGTAQGALLRFDDRARPLGPPQAAHAGRVEAVAFSADGQRIGSAGDDGLARVWDAAAPGAALFTLKGHVGAVAALAFGPDGRRIATGGADRSVRLWDALTGRPFGVPLKGHTAAITALAFNRDGSLLASASADRTVRRWPAVDRWPQMLCGKLTQRLTRAQWQAMVAPAEIAYDPPCAEAASAPQR